MATPTVSTKPYVIVPGYSIALVREPGVEIDAAPRIGDAPSAACALRKYIGDRDREVFAVALLSVRHKPLGFHTVSVGCLSSSLVHPREVFKVAALSGAAAIILCHNHPSGDPEPSAEDLALTRRLVAGGTLLGIEVLDHIILGEGSRFVSLKDRGVI